MAVNAHTRAGTVFVLADVYQTPQDVLDTVNKFAATSLTGSLSAADDVWLVLERGGAIRYSEIVRLEEQGPF